MILEIPVGWGGFSIILWTGIILGAFHSIIPCSQKYPVIFYSFGVARDWKQGFRIINFYGAGLLVINLIIGAIVTYFGAVFSKFFQINRNILNEVSGGILIISGIIMIIQIKNNRYWPHSDQMHELTESLSTLRSRKRTAFLLGILAGIPPCPMEITIYSYATIFSINYGWGNGVWTVLFFGLGTWIGLIPLALLGSASGKVSRILRNLNKETIQDYLRFKQIKEFMKKQKSRLNNKNGAKNKENIENVNGQLGKSTVVQIDPLDEFLNTPKSNQKTNISSKSKKIELFSAYALIFFGIVFIILGLFNVPIIPENSIPDVPWPF